MVNNPKQKRRKDSFFNLYFTSTISIALVLFIIGLTTFLLIWTQQITNQTKENIAMTLVIKDNAEMQEVQRIQKYLENVNYIKSYRYISKEEALQEHITDLGDDPTEFLGYNPLFATIEIYLKADYANADSIQWIEQRLTTYDCVQESVYQKDMITTLNQNIKKVSFILLGVAALLLLISTVLIKNTIHISMYSRRFIINTMKLVGANHWFIRAPFIKQFIINGIISAILAIVGLAGAIYYIQTEVGSAVSLFQPSLYIPVIVIVFVLGLLITGLSALASINRYLRMSTDDLYYI